MSIEFMGDPYAAQLRAAKAEGELARIKDELREFAEDNGFNPELEPRELLAKAAGSFRSCAAMSDARYEEIRELKAEMEAMRPRLMPEGCEWPVFEDGDPVRIGDEYADTFGANTVATIEFGYGYSAINPNTPGGYVVGKFEGAHGRYVPRPAPKVLDADGAEIREKRDVWWICEGDERGVHAERLRVETICPNGLIECSPYNGGTWVYLEPSELYVNKPVLDADGEPLEVGQTVWTLDNPSFECVVFGFGNGMVHLKSGVDHLLQREPSQLTHQRPVLDADGRPLREGETVWLIDTGAEYWVKSGQTITSDAVVIIRKTDCDCESEIVKASQLTHQRPVLDADGVPIKVGDTVYFTDGREHECNTVVHAKYDYKDEPYVQFGRLNEAGYPTYTNCSCIDPSQLTHAKPEPPDSVERIADEIDRLREEVALHLGDYLYDEDGNDSIQFSMELVAKRCRALAERERSEA